MAINRLKRVGSSLGSCFLSILSGQVAVKVRLLLAGDAWGRGQVLLFPLAAHRIPCRATGDERQGQGWMVRQWHVVTEHPTTTRPLNTSIIPL